MGCTSVVLPTGVKGKDCEKSEMSLLDPEGLPPLWVMFRTRSEAGMRGLSVVEELKLDYARIKVSQVWVYGGH